MFVDFGGKSQGIAKLSLFEKEPKVGDEMEFNVERYDASEGLLILGQKGAANQNVTWENVEVGQIVEGMVTGVEQGWAWKSPSGMRRVHAVRAGGYLFPAGSLNTFLNQKVKAEVPAVRSACEESHHQSGGMSWSTKKGRAEITTDGRTGRRGRFATGRFAASWITAHSSMPMAAWMACYVSENTHRRGIKPSDFEKVGDNVEVKDIRIDNETGKLSLSLKQKMADPRIGAENKYSHSARRSPSGVSKVENFGMRLSKSKRR